MTGINGKIITIMLLIELFVGTADACGPYHITKAYWTDAGKPTLNNQSPNEKTAFYNCVKDLGCATLTLDRYMQNFVKDCNNDSKIDCDDFISIHVNGPFGCNKQLPSGVEEIYEDCKNKTVLDYKRKNVH
ncbi:unnamed protein product [Psylliodes chrysocephalus]|uniref:lysozyme n=1 Tax=Psylliodes chrysocephalus TaxID=3402493 RepID=A0A9P0CYV8_9CUCU|nr:unnamed protein product [Psylliodes chrysocephala]